MVSKERSRRIRSLKVEKASSSIPGERGQNRERTKNYVVRGNGREYGMAIIPAKSKVINIQEHFQEECSTFLSKSDQETLRMLFDYRVLDNGSRFRH